MAADFLTPHPSRSRGAPLDQTKLLDLSSPEAIRAVADKLGDVSLDLTFVIKAQERVTQARAQFSPKFQQGQSREEVVAQIRTDLLLKTVDNQLRDIRSFIELGPQWPDKLLAQGSTRARGKENAVEPQTQYEYIQANRGKTRATGQIQTQQRGMAS